MGESKGKCVFKKDLFIKDCERNGINKNLIALALITDVPIVEGLTMSEANEKLGYTLRSQWFG